MIAVDTSALMAIVLNEPPATACRTAIGSDAPRLISAVTLAEALIVSARRGLSEEMGDVLRFVGAEIVPVTVHVSRQAAAAYASWGKGVHPARLNLADCFAYALARSRGCRLLYVGEDFAQTDVASALAP